MRIAKKITTLACRFDAPLAGRVHKSNRLSTIAPSPLKRCINGASFIWLVMSLLVFQGAAAQSIVYDNNGLKIELSEDIQAAIDSGVSLTFVSEFARIENFFFIHWQSDAIRRDFVVSRHTLSNRYLVHESDILEPHIFSSTRETMTYICETTLARFSKYQTVQSDSTNKHKMRLRLSKTKLPGPMRLNAFIANDWDLNSGWTSWQSDQ